MSRTPGVIFDMDGVIVDSNPAHKKAIQQFCKSHDQDVSKRFLENRLYGRTNKEWIPELFGELDDDELKELADEKEQMFRDMFNPTEHVVPGIHDFLDHLKSKAVPMAVATSAPGKNADYILSKLNITSYFDAILDSSDVEVGKPDPEVYIKASGEINRDPSECIVFEDSVSGVKAGVAAGATVVGVTTTHTKKELGACSKTIKNFKKISLKKLQKLL